MSFPHISLIYHLLDVTLFSFQGTILRIYSPLLTHRRGGDEENRTPDPLLARQVLSQLSYTPKFGLILRQKQLAVHTYCLRRFFLV